MGIFSRFRQKPPADERMSALAEILEGNQPDIIVETARRLICDLDPNGCVQTLIGYKNMKHINLLVSKRLRAEQVKAGVKDDRCPDSIETYGKFLATSRIPNEPTRRRFYWFLYGLFLMKAENIAEHDPAYRESVAAIWHHLSESRDIIENVLRDNILWTDDEKDVGMRNRRQRTPTVYL
jgi:hypothetical protein